MIVVPPSGLAVNPSDKDHQKQIRKALSKELKRKKSINKIYPKKSLEDDRKKVSKSIILSKKVVDKLVDRGKRSAYGVSNSLASIAAVQESDKKYIERPRTEKEKELQREEKLDAEKKKKQLHKKSIAADIDRIDEILALSAEKDKKIAARRKKRRELKGNRIHPDLDYLTKVDRARGMDVTNEEFVLTEDVSKALRTTKQVGSLFKDFYRGMLHEGMVPGVDVKKELRKRKV
ncbi:Ribosome biogenesis protein Nop53/GLTSCR2 like protein [Aduncisulcus paluster]|uniref:Ribosome biogenesis protein NOP53 n=1 Tax=Aduncisulcus paluster TaxID=2918883 RepID=A0ABQ5JZW5_9EUKA|nr:Ribosome biogenesis protein Nop53/GLTSCR2 like protein [Aduncisulcus paluster]|eukprot:gnl/Carplike_NY0171/296_a412_4229.p1 GENE.gnl/Carplike_NY0171/296_a412_4229~~gnl/Carplike_NY0171/296_a412_4229.p1  ORF type:complete len:233 (-),score=60.11 gnl/Carplike_NY0171/296_a412_4229:52-750(-)